MNRKLLIAISALVIAMFGLAACGSDDDDSTDTDAATTTEETTTEADSGGSEGGGAGGTAEIAADPSGTLAYTTGTVEVDSGPVMIDFENASSTGHDVRIEDSSGNDIGGTEVFAGSTESVELALEPGTYTYYCSVGGHRAAGMEETLTVK